jgi:hypothetical protein
MAMKGLGQFNEFSFSKFQEGKRLVYVKSEPWIERDDSGNEKQRLGSKVLLQIVEDRTVYMREDTNNFGAQLTVKVRGQEPSDYVKLKPLGTEVTIADVERAVVWGDFRNEISVIAKVVPVKGGGE